MHLPVVGSLFANVPGYLSDMDEIIPSSTTLRVPSALWSLQATSSQVLLPPSQAIAAEAPMAP